MDCFQISLAVLLVVSYSVSGKVFYEEDLDCLDCVDVSDNYRRECRCRTYTFAFSGLFPFAYWDEETNQPAGPDVEIVKKVCEFANRDCDLSVVNRNLCWDGEISQVLNGKWFDVCAGLSNQKSSPRNRMYTFPCYGFFEIPNFVVVARPGANITEAMIRDPTNDFKLALFRNPTSIIVHSLDRFYEAGYFIKPHNLIYIDAITPNEGLGILRDLLNEACEKENNDEQADLFIFVSTSVPKIDGEDYTFVAEFDGDLGIHSLMFRKDERCLMSWWDQAYEALICSDGYLDFCQGLNEAGGNRYDTCKNQSICNELN